MILVVYARAETSDETLGQKFRLLLLLLLLARILIAKILLAWQLPGADKPLSAIRVNK